MGSVAFGALTLSTQTANQGASRSFGPAPLVARHQAKPPAYGGSLALTGLSVFGSVASGAPPPSSAARNLRPLGPAKLLRTPPRAYSVPVGASLISGVSVFGTATYARAQGSSPPGASQAKNLRPIGPAKLGRGRPLGTSVPITASLNGLCIFGSVGTGAPAALPSVQPAAVGQVDPSNRSPYHLQQFGERPLSLSVAAATTPMTGVAVLSTANNGIAFGSAAASGVSSFGSALYGASTGRVGLTGVAVTGTVAYGALTSLQIAPLTGTAVFGTATYGTAIAVTTLTGMSVTGTAAYGTLTAAAAATGLSAFGTTNSGTLTAGGALSGIATGLSATFGKATGSGALPGRSVFGTALYGAGMTTTQANLAGVAVFGTAAYGAMSGAGAPSGLSVFGSVPYGLATNLNAGAMVGRYCIFGTAALGNLTAAAPLTGVSVFGSALNGKAQAGALSVYGYAVVRILAANSVTSITITSQVGDVMPAEQAFLEGSACFAQITYYDINGVNFTPSAVSWQLLDLTSGTTVLPYSSIAPGLTNTIVIPGSANEFISLTRQFERRQLVFMVTDGEGNVAYADGFYELQRVGPPEPSSTEYGQAQDV